MRKPASKFVLALLICVSVSVLTVVARESWPEPSEATKQRLIADKKLDEETWSKVLPIVLEQAKQGKPYVPGAGKPEDLPQADIPAFPGAEGAGRLTVGGRGGKVYVVTSLDDEGPGTFREACEAPGPRIVVFNVAGIIHLKRPVHIRAPYITIAGQSAPGDGVCIADRTTHIDTHDVVIRYMRFRRGSTDVGERDDSLGGEPIGNIVVDHCSCSWGFDENVSLYRHIFERGEGGTGQKLPVVNITVQWCISSEALDTFNHAFGGTWGGRNDTFHHNLFACNTGRNPSIGMGFDFNFINNVMFNWRHRTTDGGDFTTRGNLINNYFKPGPVTDGSLRYRVVKAESRSPTKGAPPEFGRWYVAGNYIEGQPDLSADNWTVGADGSSAVQFDPGAGNAGESTAVQKSPEKIKELMAIVRAPEQFPMQPVNIQSAKEAYEAVLANGGATLPRRDPVDARIMDEVRTGNVAHPEGKGIITDVKQVGGWPEYKGDAVVDSDKDGIPDWWEKKYGLNPNDASDATKDLNGDGYTNIEKYLSGIDPTKKLDFKDPKNNVSTLTAEKLFAAASTSASPKASDAKAAAGNAKPADDAAYTQTIEKRTQDILALLGITDSAKLAKVHDAIMAQYRALNDWQNNHGDAAQRQELHKAFVAKLSAELTPEQVDKVKDKMVYGKVKVTYDAYLQIVPNLTDEDKSQIMSLLKDAREEAMDGVNTKEKDTIFKKYKGKINNYLSAKGHDVGQAYKDFGEKQKEAAAAKIIPAANPGK